LIDHGSDVGSDNVEQINQDDDVEQINQDLENLQEGGIKGEEVDQQVEEEGKADTEPNETLLL
jgi:hypothetical protein